VVAKPTVPDAGARPLDRDEIDRRIRTAAAALDDHAEDEDCPTPRWVAAEELVRRLRPFMSSN
jgi:hypothetical protein